MAEKLTGICPCGFSYITPHSEDDAAPHNAISRKKDISKRLSKRLN